MLDLDVIGFRADGTPIHSVRGGADGGGDDGGGDGGGEGDGGGGDEGQLGEAGLKALERERDAARNAKDALRPWRVLAKELGVAGPDEVRNRLRAMTEDQQKAAEERDRRDAEILDKANRRVIASTIKALAAKDFADPQDAVLNLSQQDYDVTDDGEVDEKAIQRDLADLLKRKPHLSATSKKVDFEGGARKTASAPLDMNTRIRNLAGRN